MPKPKFFVSSTYMDLREVRDAVGNFLQCMGYDVKMFERGGVYYDHMLTLEDSCNAEVQDSHFFILIIAGRYGAPSRRSATKSSVYNSITKSEFMTALQSGIPMLVFVQKEVYIEFTTYQNLAKAARESYKFTYVDNVNVFKLVEDVKQMNSSCPILTYETYNDIINGIKQQLAGKIEKILQSEKELSTKTELQCINSYKLFYFRSQKGMSFGTLSMAASLDRSQLWKLERIKKKRDALDIDIFPRCERKTIERLEEVFGCPGYLRCGRPDDFLSAYIQYYATYKQRKKLTPALGGKVAGGHTKAVVFDFDGTLTYTKDNLTTWERIWTSLGYDLNECYYYHQLFSENKLSHREWCEVTQKKFRARNLTYKALVDIAKTIQLVPGTAEIIKALHLKNVKIYILSGSIRKIIKLVLGDLYEYIEDIEANDLIFNERGTLVRIRGTKYDFEGKSAFIKNIITDNHFDPLEVLFIGNSCNDIYACRSGAVTLCVNPTFTDPHNKEHWTYCIREMKDLSLINQYINLPPTEPTGDNEEIIECDAPLLPPGQPHV